MLFPDHPQVILGASWVCPDKPGKPGKPGKLEMFYLAKILIILLLH
jgi:hypothetical protein